MGVGNVFLYAARAWRGWSPPTAAPATWMGLRALQIKLSRYVLLVGTSSGDKKLDVVVSAHSLYPQHECLARDDAGTKMSH